MTIGPADRELHQQFPVLFPLIIPAHALPRVKMQSAICPCIILSQMKENKFLDDSLLMQDARTLDPNVLSGRLRFEHVTWVLLSW